MVNDLCQAVSDGQDDRILELCRLTTTLLLERNRQCKLSKCAR